MKRKSSTTLCRIKTKEHGTRTFILERRRIPARVMRLAMDEFTEVHRPANLVAKCDRHECVAKTRYVSPIYNWSK